ncbi:helix-turn-helix domain-containing protein [Kurthia gibsonii]|uniref:helix-turn-helix domain-containing protein n=1 Tax=Kurthia gibsonii TaxID=33946 RepID=UPI002DBAA06F|nr:MerR family transcriptional regulator [Kurthia gibsonii]MEB7772575.1 MerR family transcriptional regulator [Kurthia gibsonii]
MEKMFGTAEFAIQVGVTKSSLKHYISILENSGYHVKRDHRNYRLFTEEDVHVFQNYKQLHQEKGMTLKEAAAVIIGDDTIVQDAEMLPAKREYNTQVVEKYDDLSKTMELLADHIQGIEAQNAQLLQLIQMQHQQNEWLKEEMSMMKHQLEEPKVDYKRQLDRVESQNSAIMSVLNKLTVQKLKEEVQEVEPEPTGFMKGLFKRK